MYLNIELFIYKLYVYFVKNKENYKKIFVCFNIHSTSNLSCEMRCLSFDYEFQ